ncbi:MULTISPECIES: A/G-specific adenine glycosylase [Geobacter]|uniref:A/G-specific adenine glycosylase n=1 Tax=Geobacter TaxID=28231 RepID=UPI002573AA1D|nr:A/G-specific adenine glycosylase [Geobacter sulfurreducens]BEH10406.1 endonuclease III [Geobacter sulfurreducens subsp. ethanolicus]BET58007.1 endonuclease III [Geobacter sp. 60473]
MNREQKLTHLFRQEGLTPAVADLFRRIVYDWYAPQRRELPWRETFDPYAILVSEIMLQQTQVERVREKYATFLAEFPDLRTLAAAPLERVLAAWQGLGYNRRAVNLKRCAEAVVASLGGEFPADPNELVRLPGIGAYTSRAVAAFAFNTPLPFIETNIRSVYIHHFFADQSGIHDRDLMPLIEQTLDRGNPREWYYALMDYGSHLKRLHGNPSRRSSHHTRQTPFKGSNREVRSRILRAVLENPGISRDALEKTVGASSEIVGKNLEQLAAEGFIVLRGPGYRIQ